MDLRLRNPIALLFALALAALVSACTGVADDGDSIQFAINGDNGAGCSRVLVEVSAGTVSRRDDDSIHCALSGLLEDAGCKADFLETDNDSLQVEIHGCQVDAGALLFRCGFTDYDLEELESTTRVVCACDRLDCDATPPVCLAVGGRPDSCEDCNNGVDDDGDGAEDCFDPGCEASRLCDDVTTTSTSSTTSSTDSPAASTTTTLFPSLPRFTVVIALESDAAVGAIQFDILYGDAVSRRRAVMAEPECRSLVEVVSSSFDHEVASQTIHADMVLAEGLEGPVELAECTFEATTIPEAGDFEIVVVEATDPEGGEIAPPSLTIDSVEPTPVTTTLPPTTTTTTTVPEPTGDEFLVTFHLESSSSAIGALQVGVDYTSAEGGFKGSGASVSCSNNVGGALFAANDVDATRKLTLGWIALSPFTAPTSLGTCVFVADVSAPAPAPGGFSISIEDAINSDGVPAAVVIGTTVTPTID